MPAGCSTSGSSWSLCSSAFWMRRSTSRIASRYSVSFARSPCPSDALQMRHFPRHRVENAAILLHPREPRASGSVLPRVAKQPLEHRARVVLHRQRRGRRRASRSCWCRRRRSPDRRRRPTASTRAPARATPAACACPSSFAEDLVHRDPGVASAPPLGVIFGCTSVRNRVLAVACDAVTGASAGRNDAVQPAHAQQLVPERRQRHHASA